MNLYAILSLALAYAGPLIASPGVPGATRPASITAFTAFASVSYPVSGPVLDPPSHPVPVPVADPAVEPAVEPSPDPVAEAESSGTFEQVRVFAPVEVIGDREPSRFGLYGICAGAALMLLGMFWKKPVAR